MTTSKTILITGSTDGIGLETAKMLVKRGHRVLLHGRNVDKLERAKAVLSQLTGDAVAAHRADLSVLSEVERLAATVAKEHPELDALINNAGVYHAPEGPTADGLEIRFVVNTIAPYLLMQRLLPQLGKQGRVINLSSAAQASVDTEALLGNVRLSPGAAYAQSKLALTHWTQVAARNFGVEGPVIIAVNPGSLLATKMVKEAFGVSGGDVSKGATILVRAALDGDFADKSGCYFDNDSGHFSSGHPDLGDPRKGEQIVALMDRFLAQRA